MKKAVCAILFLCCHVPALGGRPFNPSYGKWDDVSGITMILSADELPTGTQLTEAQLPEVGCTFHVNDPTLIAEVLKIVHPAMIAGETKPVRLRHALYLTMKGPPRSEAKYLIAERQGSAGTVGSIDAPGIRSETIYFTTRLEISDSLREWAKTHIALLSFIPPRSDPSNPCTFLP